MVDPPLKKRWQLGAALDQVRELVEDERTPPALELSLARDPGEECGPIGVSDRGEAGEARLERLCEVAAVYWGADRSATQYTPSCPRSHSTRSRVLPIRRRPKRTASLPPAA